MNALEIHITPLAGGLAVAALALALIAAFRLGRWLGRSSGYLEGRRSERQGSN